MTILEELSSRVGLRSNVANHQVGLRCLENPALLKEIAGGLTSKDARLVADCCEVFTQTALSKPELIVPYASVLPKLMSHKNGRVRWETMHCVALIAHLVPKDIKPHTATFAGFVEKDRSVIVRDYATDALGNYGGTGADAAWEVYPYLKAALYYWDGKHAGHALAGLAKVRQQLPQLGDDVRRLAEPFLDHPKAVVRRAAKQLLKKGVN